MLKRRQQFKAGPFVGLEITPVAVRAVEITAERAGEPVVRRVAQAEVPQGLVSHGQILDPAGVAAALRQLWEKGNFSTRRCCVALPAGALTLQMLTLPPAPRQEQRLIVRGELERFAPVHQEASFGWMPMTAGGGPGGNTLAFMAPDGMIAGYEQALALAGLEVEVCEPDSIAALRALELGPNRPGPGQDPLRARTRSAGTPPAPDRPPTSWVPAVPPPLRAPAPEGSLGATAAVFVSDTCSEIAFLEAGRVRYYRRLDLGLDELTGVSAAERQPIADCGLRIADLELPDNPQSAIRNPQCPDGEAGEKLRPLAQEIQRSLLYYGRAYSDCPQPQKVQLLGDFPPLERLAQIVREELNLEAEYLGRIADFGFRISGYPNRSPASSADVADVADQGAVFPSYLQKSGTREAGGSSADELIRNSHTEIRPYSVALGSALRPLGEQQVSAALNLSARDEAEVLARHAPRYLMAALSGSTVCVLMTLASSLLLNARLSQVQGDWRAAQAELQRVNTERATSAVQVRQARMETNRLRQQSLPIPQFLTRLSGLVPQSVSMTSLELKEDGSVTLEGEAQTPQQIDGLLQQLSSDVRFRAANLEALDSSGQGGTTRFTVQTGLVGCGTKRR